MPKYSYIHVKEPITFSHTNLLSTRCTLFYFYYTNLLRVGRRSEYMPETCKHFVQGGSNMTGTDLCVNKSHCAATVRP